MNPAKDAKLSTQVVGQMGVTDLEPQTIIQAVHQSPAKGAHLQARRLAIQGTNLYPDNAELAKMAHILARPVVTRRKGKNSGDARNNQLWLKRNFDNYKGKWVALRNGKLLGVADSMRELRAILPDITNVMMTRV
jgi:hypothetical protein